MERREKIFLILASVFVTSLVVANIVGITKFFSFRVPLWNHVVDVPVGILVYPITFLATDLTSELYGRRRANWLVFVGFLMNILLFGICAFGQWLKSSSSWLETLEVGWHADVYERVWTQMQIGIQGSMAAYLVAQFVDVQLFHFWKRLTGGRHLWFRNNASTMLSQLADTVVILTIVFGAEAASGELETSNPFGDGRATGYAALGVFVLNSYLFKVFFAAADTPFAYVLRFLLEPGVGGPDPGEARYGEGSTGEGRAAGEASGAAAPGG